MGNDINVEELLNSIDELLKKDEVENLVKEVQMDTSLLRKKPEEIKNNFKLSARMEELENFQILNEIYVLPLYYLAIPNFSTKDQREYNFDINDDLSIMGRVIKLRNYLVSKGYKMQDILELIPNQKQDVDILMAARKKGLIINPAKMGLLKNSIRVDFALNYLSSLKNITNSENKNGYGK